MIHFATLAYPWRRNHEAVPYPSQPPKQSLSGFLVKQDRLFSRLVIASHRVRHNQPIKLNVTSLLGFFIYYTTDRLGYKCDHYSPSANFKTARTTASMKRPNLPCGMACSLALAGLLLSLQAQAQVQAATPSTASAQKSSAATKTIVPKRELLGRAWPKHGIGLWAMDMPVSIAAAVGFTALVGQASLNGVRVLSAPCPKPSVPRRSAPLP